MGYRKGAIVVHGEGLDNTLKCNLKWGGTYITLTEQHLQRLERMVLDEGAWDIKVAKKIINGVGRRWLEQKKY